MARYVELFSEMESGDESHVVRVQIDEPGGLVDAGRGDGVAARASRSIESMAERIRPIAHGVARTFSGPADGPDEVQVAFGISFSSEADVVVSRASAEASFQVTLTWNRAAENESGLTGQQG